VCHNIFPYATVKFPDTVNVATLNPLGIVETVFVPGLTDTVAIPGHLTTTIPLPPAFPI